MVDAGFVGRTLDPSPPYQAGREKIRELARAIGEDAPVCLDLEAARAAGYPDVVAPGVGVRTTDLYGLYAVETGTSVAAPHVAGILALLLGAFPLTAAERQATALRTTAVDLGPPGADNDYGAGGVDALAAYDYLATTPDFTLAT